jgi:hypothetical protein
VRSNTLLLHALVSTAPMSSIHCDKRSVAYLGNPHCPASSASAFWVVIGRPIKINHRLLIL